MSLGSRLVGSALCALLVLASCRNSPGGAEGAKQIDGLLAAREGLGGEWGATLYVRVPLPSLPEIDEIVFDPLSVEADWVDPRNKAQQDAILAILDDWERRLASDAGSQEPVDPAQVSRAVQTAVSAYVARSRIEAGRGETALAVRDTSQALTIAWDSIAEAPGASFADQAPAFLIAAEHATGLCQDRRIVAADMERLRSAVGRFSDFDLEPQTAEAFAGQRALFAAMAKSRSPSEIATGLTSPMGDPAFVERAIDNLIKDKGRALDWGATARLLADELEKWDAACRGTLVEAKAIEEGSQSSLVSAWGFDPVTADYAAVRPTGDDLPEPNAVGRLLVHKATAVAWPMFEAAGRCRLAAIGLAFRVEAEAYRLKTGAYPSKASEIARPASVSSTLWDSQLQPDFVSWQMRTNPAAPLVPGSEATRIPF